VFKIKKEKEKENEKAVYKELLHVFCFFECPMRVILI